MANKDQDHNWESQGVLKIPFRDKFKPKDEDILKKLLAGKVADVGSVIADLTLAYQIYKGEKNHYERNDAQATRAQLKDSLEKTKKLLKSLGSIETTGQIRLQKAGISGPVEVSIMGSSHGTHIECGTNFKSVTGVSYLQAHRAVIGLLELLERTLHEIPSRHKKPEDHARINLAVAVGNALTKAGIENLNNGRNEIFSEILRELMRILGINYRDKEIGPINRDVRTLITKALKRMSDN
ncbi:hypothetical protein E3V39_13055 [Gammaproteobacteria bacterium LSUCC0112]|nr:hypothetical protein E3V39_13055 [Gammaproteobacteria bacterium LSUCC0112]